MISRLSEVVELTEEAPQRYGLIAMYVTGSFVNGYYRKDSDVDVVGITPSHSRNEPVEQGDISLHLIHPDAFSIFEAGAPYMHLRSIPLMNPELCQDLSDSIKTEIVRRQLIRFKAAGIDEVTPWQLIQNHLFRYGAGRPWRITPINRLFESTASRSILSGEYARICDLHPEMLISDGAKYRINPEYSFDDAFEEHAPSLSFLCENSLAGFYYLKEWGERKRFLKSAV